MDERNAIGVVGGLGPYAGLDLVRKIFDETEASGDQEHLPVVLISYPARVPDRSTFVSDPSAPSPVAPLIEILGRLAAAGCSVVGIPCNTAHAPTILEPLYEAVEREAMGLRLLDMIELSVGTVLERAPGARRVGVIATTGTIQSGVYHRALQQHGLEAVVPAAEVQEGLVTPVIFDREWGLKAQSDPPTPRARRQLLGAVDHLRREGAEAVILGCTELPLAAAQAQVEGLPVIDSTRSLARGLIRAAHPDGLRRR